MEVRTFSWSAVKSGTGDSPQPSIHSWLNQKSENLYCILEGSLPFLWPENTNLNSRSLSSYKTKLNSSENYN